MFDEVKLAIKATFLGMCLFGLGNWCFDMYTWYHDPYRGFDSWPFDKQAAIICGKAGMATYYPMQQYRFKEGASEVTHGMYLSVISTTLVDGDQRDKITFKCMAVRPQGKWQITILEQQY